MSVSASAKPRYGVEPVASEEVSVEAPFCLHGPTLVFERFYADREPRKFFACALHRDRKGCPFFHWTDEPISGEKRDRWARAFHEANPPLDRSSLTETLQKLQSLPDSQQAFCHTCSLLFPTSDLSSSSPHTSHEVKTGPDLLHPTSLLAPRDDKKSQAQFFFSAKTCRLLVTELRRLGVSKVLCIGTPRLHEALLAKPSASPIPSLLLDVDQRYASFYCSSSYQCYNMFNGHFYEQGGEEACHAFLTSGSVAMVIDPPFGGLVSVLAKQVQHLQSLCGGDVYTILVLPYFMEQHVLKAFPSLTMCDYQVTYDNHKHFSTSRKATKPSPVRFFTDLPPPGLVLPCREGYQQCTLCHRYVAPNNSHCSFCDDCTSKDGRKYRHCAECGVCVKPGRQHCTTCGSCMLPGHHCGDRMSIGCHCCGSMDHKRRDCPERAEGRVSERGSGGEKEEESFVASSSKVKRKGLILDYSPPKAKWKKRTS